MTWTKLDDSFYSHRKIVGLSDRAFRLYVCGLNWSVAHHTDGHIPNAIPAMLAPNSTQVARRRAIGELTDLRLWTPSDGGWEIHDFADYQPTADQLADAKKAKSGGGILGNHRRWHTNNPDPNCSHCRSQVRSDNRSEDRGGVRPDTESDSESHTDRPNPNPNPNPRTASSSDADDDAMSKAEYWARRWIRITGQQGTRAVIRRYTQQAQQHHDATGTWPTEQQLHTAHQRGITQPSGWGFAPPNPTDDWTTPPKPEDLPGPARSRARARGEL